MYSQDVIDIIKLKIVDINKLITTLYTARRGLNNCISFLESKEPGYPEYGLETAKELLSDLNQLIIETNNKLI